MTETANDFDTGAPGDEVRRLVLAFMVSSALGVVAEFGVADRLADGAKSADSLAAECGASSSYLRRLLRLLVAHGIFLQLESGYFANSSMSEFLRQEHPSSQRNFAMFIRRQALPAVAHLLEAVQTGSSPFVATFGESMFDYLSQNPADAENFTKAMANAAALRAERVLSYSWPDSGTVVDVGGADGAILVRILASRPNLNGVVFDRPHVEQSAMRAFERAGVADRCRFVGGDFFENVWSGGDIYLLSTVIHDWDDRESALILGNCRKAMAPGGRLLIADHVLPSQSTPHPGFALDVLMMILTSGHERSDAEWRELLDQAGFVVESITARDRMSLVEASAKP